MHITAYFCAMESYIQSIQCFGPVSFFTKYKQSEKVWIEMHENYQKRSWRNRYQILSSQGPEMMSIPLVKGKNEKQPVSEVRIAYDEPWVTRQLQTIRSAYGKSPYFEDIFPDIDSILQKKHRYLCDLDMESTLWALQKLSADTNKIVLSTAYLKMYENTEDCRNEKVAFPEYSQKHYAQVWEERFGFVEDLSIIDLLFCTGPEAGYYL
jgi:hypothetical protein